MKYCKPTAFHELSPLSESDCFYVIERRKSEFTFPLHCHAEYEINYVENGAGARRIVGDSVEEIGDYDLALISGENLEHAWETHNCTSGDIREITVQFSGDWLKGALLNKNQFMSIRKMLDSGGKGVVFALPTILKLRYLLNSLTSESFGFYSVINFLSLLYELSVSKDMRTLASSSFARSYEQNILSRRVMTVDNYLKQRYASDIKLADVASMVNMNGVAFSRFFARHAGKSFTDYLADIRMGHVTRLLIDSNKSIAEICYECGYNNISNFNRIFRKKKGRSPREFRDLYRKKHLIF
ncbi:MAG: AraC family transcriptional regulator [Rikenellaceae bacterium]|jgi:AraC-like DNA-binding protein|nr:AraC family transcriptional regulator [Rikenellaceae bacterium]